MYTRGRGNNANSRSSSSRSSTRGKAKESKRKAKGKERGNGSRKEVGTKLHPVHTDFAAASQPGCQQCKPMGESERPTRCWPRCSWHLSSRAVKQRIKRPWWRWWWWRWNFTGNKKSYLVVTYLLTYLPTYLPTSVYLLFFDVKTISPKCGKWNFKRKYSVTIFPFSDPPPPNWKLFRHI